MASKSQKFNASVNFGASVDPSMTRTLNRLTSGIDRIGTETQRVTRTQTAWQRQMKAGSASTANQLKHMERATQALINKHEALEKEIRDSVKNGRAGTDLLIENYKKVGQGIEDARKEMEKLNREQERETREEEKRARRQARLDRLRVLPGQGLRMGGRALWSGARRGLSLGASVVGVSGALGLAGSFGSILGLNHKTAEEYRLAKQYGMSYQHYKTGSILAEQAGLNGENFGDLSEELSNKLGEIGNDKTLNPMLAQIGLNKHLKGSKQQQFDEVMQKISVAVRKGILSDQQGESLADQLMGGEANKLMTYIVGMNKTYKEAMESAGELNNITEDEARAALESSQILSNMWTSAETTLQGVAGEFGKAMEPQLKIWESEFTQWMRDNKDKITKSIGDWVDGGGPKRLIDNFEKAGRGLAMLGKEAMVVGSALSFLLPDSPEKKAQKKEVTDALEPVLNGTGFLGGESPSPFMQQLQMGAEAMDLAEQPHNQSGQVIPFNQRGGNNTANVTNNYAVTFNLPQTDNPQEFASSAYEHFRQLTGTGDAEGSNTFDVPLL